MPWGRLAGEVIVRLEIVAIRRSGYRDADGWGQAKFIAVRCLETAKCRANGANELTGGRPNPASKTAGG